MRRLFLTLGILVALCVALLFLDRYLFISRILPNSLRDSICKTARSRSATPFKLAEMTSFEWEKVYIIPPYADSKAVKDILDFEWEGAGRTGISSSDGFKLLVFVKSGKVVEWHRQPRNCGDFELRKDAARKNGFTPEEAVFSIIEEDYGEPWLVLKPAIPGT